MRIAALVLASTLLLAGCANAPVSVDEAVSASLQVGVIEVADAAANGDYDASLALLDELQEALDAAIADDALTAGKAASIQAAIDAVRSDLTELAEPEPEPEPDPEPTVEPEKPGKGNAGKPEKPGKPGKGN